MHSTNSIRQEGSHICRMPICFRKTIALTTICLTITASSPTLAQQSLSNDTGAQNDQIRNIDDVLPFRQTRYSGEAILIHLPTRTARALVMPEPVTLQGNLEQMPGLELAYEDEVVGFFATRDFSRRAVSFIGEESGTEYRLQIRASENGIVEPLEIVR